MWYLLVIIILHLYVYYWNRRRCHLEHRCHLIYIPATKNILIHILFCILNSFIFCFPYKSPVYLYFVVHCFFKHHFLLMFKRKRTSIFYGTFCWILQPQLWASNLIMQVKCHYCCVMIYIRTKLLKTLQIINSQSHFVLQNQRNKNLNNLDLKTQKEKTILIILMIIAIKKYLDTQSFPFEM